MTFEQFSQLISDISNVPVEKITEDSSFRDDLGIDSLQMVNLFTYCFEIFEAGIEVVEDPNNLKTVGNLYRALNRGEMNEHSNGEILSKQ